VRARKVDTKTRKKQIAQAAAELIGEEGINNLSIAAIAAKLGIVTSGVYKHYSGKEEIITAVIGLMKQLMVENVAAATSSSDNALQQLQYLLNRHLNMLMTNRGFPQIIFTHYTKAALTAERDEVGELLFSFIENICQLIQQGKKNCTIRHDVTPRAAAVLFIGLIMPAAVLSGISKGKFDPFAHVESVWPLFERAVAAESIGVV
jgi:AcrR family transcriptional regulator